jgi:hypothetical protein
MYRKKNPTKIVLNNDTAYLAGVIVGDGHISSSYKSSISQFKDYHICLDLSDKAYVTYLHSLVSRIIPMRSSLIESSSRQNSVSRLKFTIRNKELYLFLTDILKIPSGKKSYIVTVPDVIISSTEEL